MDKILVVEDDRFFREMYVKLLRDEGYLVTSACCGSEAMELLAKDRYGLVITDLVMPDVSGMELLTRVREFDPGIDVIMVTGNANLESAIFALKHGARDYLTKPVNHDEFRHSVAQCMQQRRLLDENQELKNLLNLFQTSQAIAGCLEIERVHHLMVESIAREFGVSRAMGLFRGDDQLELKEVKGLSADNALACAGAVQAWLDRNPAPDRLIEKITFQGGEACPGDIREACLVFVRDSNELLGVIAAFNDPSRELVDTIARRNNVKFLLEQSARAFKNAENYSHAKDLLFIDDLSGLFNHRYLEVALDRELKRVERYESNLAVLFLDLDSFKQVNDTHGHLVGSSVLREMADLLKKSTREVDVVIRYGGDEYTIILVETGPATAAIVAERIRSQIASHTFLASEGHTIRLTCSIGYACCPDDSVSKQELLDMADQAMYGGKAGGKNCVKRFTRPS